eukprot:SAG22_NODE_7803_length_707_cov_1.223684_1_plen_193_part_10
MARCRISHHFHSFIVDFDRDTVGLKLADGDVTARMSNCDKLARRSCTVADLWVLYTSSCSAVIVRGADIATFRARRWVHGVAPRGRLAVRVPAVVMLAFQTKLRVVVRRARVGVRALRPPLLARTATDGGTHVTTIIVGVRSAVRIDGRRRVCTIAIAPREIKHRLCGAPRMVVIYRGAIIILLSVVDERENA